MSNISIVEVALTDGTISEQVNIHNDNGLTIMFKDAYDEMIAAQNKPAL